MSPFVIIFLGLWLLSGHFAFGYHIESLIISDCISGLLLIILGFLAIPNRKAWVLWAISFVGLWLEMAPLFLWSPDASCYVNDTLIGALAIAFSIIIPPIPGQLPETGPSTPPGWSYNPSSWPQRLPIAFLASIAWFISRYLAAFQLGYIDHMWDPIFGNGTLDVITSKVSRAFPVSDAGLGAVSYTLDFLLTCQGGERRWRTSPWMVIIFGILVIPLSLISIVLIILQPIAVGAWCFLCLITAACMLIMLVLSVDEVAATIQYLRTSKEKPFWELFFKGGLCPKATRDGRTPPLDGPFRKVLRAGFWGITFHWSLIFGALTGIWMMVTPAIFTHQGLLADWDHILGPFVIVFSVIAMADASKKARFVNIFLALVLLLVSAILFKEQTLVVLLNHCITAIALILFTLKKI